MRRPPHGTCIRKPAHAFARVCSRAYPRKPVRTPTLAARASNDAPPEPRPLRPGARPAVARKRIRRPPSPRDPALVATAAPAHGAPHRPARPAAPRSRSTHPMGLIPTPRHGDNQPRNRPLTTTRMVKWAAPHVRHPREGGDPVHRAARLRSIAGYSPGHPHGPLAVRGAGLTSCVAHSPRYRSIRSCRPMEAQAARAASRWRLRSPAVAAACMSRRWAKPIFEKVSESSHRTPAPPWRAPVVPPTERQNAMSPKPLM
jgi:hypothetical protein